MNNKKSKVWRESNRPAIEMKPSPSNPRIRTQSPADGHAARSSSAAAAAAAGPAPVRSRRSAPPGAPPSHDSGRDRRRRRGGPRASHVQELQATVWSGGEPPLRVPLPHRPLRRWAFVRFACLIWSATLAILFRSWCYSVGERDVYAGLWLGLVGVWGKN